MKPFTVIVRDRLVRADLRGARAVCASAAIYVYGFVVVRESSIFVDQKVRAKPVWALG